MSAFQTFTAILEFSCALCGAAAFWAGCHLDEPHALREQGETTGNTREAAFTLVEAVSSTIISYFHLADRQNICQADFSCALHAFSSCQLQLFTRNKQAYT